MDDIRVQGEVLRDVKPNGKERPWREKKVQSRDVSVALDWGDLYDRVQEDSAFGDTMSIWVDDDKCFKEVPRPKMTYADAVALYRGYRVVMGWLGKKSVKMYNCASWLQFARYADGSKKLFRAQFCKDRLCPMCNWRRSMKMTAQVMKIMTEMQRRNIKGYPILLTLTMKNVKGEDIGKSISAYSEGFHRLTNYKQVKRVLMGAIRATEITYNAKDDTYNTHIHCILWMIPSYFKDKYLNKDQWIALWKRAAKLDYDPSVHVNRIKQKITESDPTGYMKGVLEITKYVTKPGYTPGVEKVFNPSDEFKQREGKRISELERGLRNKRLIGFFGIFKELHKELNLDDTEDGDLIGADGEPLGEPVDYPLFKFNDTQHNFYESTPEEIAYDNDKLKAYFENEKRKNKECAERFEKHCAEMREKKDRGSVGKSSSKA